MTRHSLQPSALSRLLRRPATPGSSRASVLSISAEISRRSRRKGAGFTILEIIVVLVIVFLLMTLLAGALLQRHNRKVDAERDREAAKIRSMATPIPAPFKAPAPSTPAAGAPDVPAAPATPPPLIPPPPAPMPAPATPPPAPPQPTPNLNP